MFFYITNTNDTAAVLLHHHFIITSFNSIKFIHEGITFEYSTLMRKRDAVNFDIDADKIQNIQKDETKKNSLSSTKRTQ